MFLEVSWQPEIFIPPRPPTTLSIYWKAFWHMNFINLWQYFSSDLQALPAGHSLAQGTLLCQFKITFMQMYPNLLYCNFAWVQWAVKVTWTAQSVWGWLPAANVPARQFKTSRSVSMQPATLEVTVVLETPWAVKQPSTNLQRPSRQVLLFASSRVTFSDWNLKFACALPRCWADSFALVPAESSSHLLYVVWNGEMWMTQVCT